MPIRRWNEIPLRKDENKAVVSFEKNSSRKKIISKVGGLLKCLNDSSCWLYILYSVGQKCRKNNY